MNQLLIDLSYKVHPAQSPLQLAVLVYVRQTLRMYAPGGYKSVKHRWACKYKEQQKREMMGSANGGQVCTLLLKESLSTNTLKVVLPKICCTYLRWPSNPAHPM